MDFILKCSSYSTTFLQWKKTACDLGLMKSFWLYHFHSTACNAETSVWEDVLVACHQLNKLLTIYNDILLNPISFSNIA